MKDKSSRKAKTIRMDEDVYHQARVAAVISSKSLGQWIEEARLTAPGLGLTRTVLAGGSGRSLAFGPGQLPGTAEPGTPGPTVISGHRDTHFRFLAKLDIGSRLGLTTADGRRHAYRVVETRVVHKDRAWLSDDGRNYLVLATCYPFDALRAGTPWRYLVIAEPVGDAAEVVAPRALRAALRGADGPTPR